MSSKINGLNTLSGPLIETSAHVNACAAIKNTARMSYHVD